MSAKDVIKNSFLKQFSTDVSTSTILIMLLVTALIGVYIFFVYRVACRKAFYSRSFAISLVAISMITAIIILTVQSSVVISLGMVGALSIVRFRTAIKDPHDTIYIFWAIVEGLCVGAGAYKLAVIAGIFIALVLTAMCFYTKLHNKYIIIVRGSVDLAKEGVIRKLSENFSSVKVRAVNNRENSVEMILEVSVRGKIKMSSVDGLKRVNGVRSANWILETGENVG